MRWPVGQEIGETLVERRKHRVPEVFSLREEEDSLTKTVSRRTFPLEPKCFRQLHGLAAPVRE